ncbi:MAG: hypothetical protein ACJAW8_002755 [Oleispira sp.]|jgi:hypothetical protein
MTLFRDSLFCGHSLADPYGLYCRMGTDENRLCIIYLMTSTKTEAQSGRYD